MCDVSADELFTSDGLLITVFYCLFYRAGGMAKRIADKELTDRNWDQEDEGEEVSPILTQTLNKFKLMWRLTENNEYSYVRTLVCYFICCGLIFKLMFCSTYTFYTFHSDFILKLDKNGEI